MKYLKMFEDFSDEDEEDDDLYSEIDDYIESLKKSRWGTFNINFLIDNTPRSFVISNSYVYRGTLNVVFIKESLFDEYNLLNYNSFNEFFDFVYNDYSLIIKFPEPSFEFTTQEDKDRFMDYVRRNDDVEEDIKLSIISHHKRTFQFFLYDYLLT